MSAITCSRCEADDSLKLFETRRSTCVRRGVYIVPGLMSGTTREVLTPPDKGRPRPVGSAWVMFHCAVICWPGRFCSTPPT